MTNMDFYLNANTVRKLVLNLCQLSKHVFEISLNSSLVTDELYNRGTEFKSYVIYSEKMDVISNSLHLVSENMLRCTTGMMELSLEKTKYLERMEKLSEGLDLLEEATENKVLVANAVKELSSKSSPIEDEARRVQGIIREDFKKFRHEIKKLWLLTTYLKSQVAFDEISYLANITGKIESVLEKVEDIINDLDGQLKELERAI